MEKDTLLKINKTMSNIYFIERLRGNLLGKNDLFLGALFSSAANHIGLLVQVLAIFYT